MGSATSYSIGRRSLLALPALMAPWIAKANDWPTRSVRMVVPFPPGGGTDNLGRMFAQALGERLGQPVIVENRGGAGGNIGSYHWCNLINTSVFLVFVVKLIFTCTKSSSDLLFFYNP